MTGVDVLERYRAIQRSLIDVLDRVRPLLDASAVLRDPAGIAALRDDFARLSAEYQRFKHREIFDPTILSGSPESARVAQRMKIECIAAAAEHQAYLGRHPEVGTGDRWPEYRLAASRQMRRMRDHLEREGQAIAKLMAMAERAETGRAEAGTIVG